VCDVPNININGLLGSRVSVAQLPSVSGMCQLPGRQQLLKARMQNA